MTPNFLYKRNKFEYDGDPLGPRFDPLKHWDVEKTLTDTNPIVDSILILPSRGLAPAGGIIGGGVGNRTGEGSKCDCQ